MLKKSLVLLDLLSGGADEPPSEFRLFKRGLNETTKGPVILTDKGLASILDKYTREGHDLLLDLEHKSLAKGSEKNTDAMAWFKLEARNGDLWATDVVWTPEGRERLLAKKQRYFSPAVLTDDKDEAFEIWNAGLVSMPATYQASALIAASKGYSENMNPELMKKIMDLVAAGDLSDDVKAIFTEIIAGAPAEEASPDPAVEQMTAAAPALLSATGADSIDGAIAVVKVWAKTADEDRKKAEALALSKRLALVGELVKLGAETPATAYEDPSAKKLSVRLLGEDLASLEGRVGVLRASRGASPNPKDVKPPLAVKTFSASEVAGAKQLGISPEDFVARKNAAVRTA